MNAPKVIGISGVKNSGKTTLISKLTAQLSGRGYRVSVLKHDGHNFDPEPIGTDTHIYSESGAQSWAIFDGEKFSFTERRKVAAEDLLPLFKGSDLVFIEGMKSSDYPKLELMREVNGTTPVCREETVIAYVTDFDYVSDRPVFNLNETDEICKYLIERLLK